METGTTMKQVLKKVLASTAILSMLGAGSSALAVDPDKLPQQYSSESQAKYGFNNGRRRESALESELPKKKPVQDTEKMSEFLGYSSSEQDIDFTPDSLGAFPLQDSTDSQEECWEGLFAEAIKIMENNRLKKMRETPTTLNLSNFLKYSSSSRKKYYSCQYFDLPQKDGKGNCLTYSFAPSLDDYTNAVIVVATVWKQGVPSTPQIIGVLQAGRVYITIDGLRTIYGKI